MDDPQSAEDRPFERQVVSTEPERLGVAPEFVSPALVTEVARVRRQELVTNFRRKMRRWWMIAIALFALTCLSTWATHGWAYAVAVMAILLSHEMGHFLQSLRYRVPASPPMFIPLPGTPFGTLGAVIVQAGGVADRKALFDIAISGPLAGLVLALPIAWWGLQDAPIAPVIPNEGTIIFSDPLVLKWMIAQTHGALPANQEVMLTPLLFAGWVGIFITALNLIPIGQLDGGHILYTLIGKKAHFVAIGLMIGAVAFMVYTHDLAYLLMVVLLLKMGPRHPPTADDRVPLGPVRIVLGWLTLGFILIGFTPRPIMVLDPVPAAPERQHRPDLEERAVERRESLDPSHIV